MGAQVVEGARGNARPEVGAPALEHRVEPAQELAEQLVAADRVIASTFACTA
jgi:hypothetical protein